MTLTDADYAAMDLVDLPVPDGTAEAYVARPGSGSGPGVLLFMDGLGLRPQIALMADRIASWGYVVLAPNVFYRDGTASEVGPHGDLTTDEGRSAFFATAGPRIAGLTSCRAVADVAAYLEALQGLEGVTGDTVATTGYCMGGRLSLRAATGHPDVVVATGGFHAGGLVTEQSDSPHLGLPAARAEFVLGHADKDRSMPPEAVAALGAAFEANGLTATNEVYAGAAHGYSMADTSMYDEGAAERHFDALRGLLSRTLG